MIRALHPAATLQFPYLKLHQFVYRHSGGLIGSRIVAGVVEDDLITIERVDRITGA